MQKAKLLLKASRGMIGDNNRITVILFTAIVWAFTGITFLILALLLYRYQTDTNFADEVGMLLLEIAGMITGYGATRSFYTGFTEVKKESSKSNFRDFALQLPVSREDVLKAQFLDLLRCVFPGALITFLLTTLSFFAGQSHIVFYSGVLVLYFVFVFLFVCLDKFIFMFTFMNARIREFIYIGIAIVPVFVPAIQRHDVKMIQTYLNSADSLSGTDSMYYILSTFKFLGSLGGLVVMILTVLIGYFLCCLLPEKLYKQRGVNK